MLIYIPFSNKLENRLVNLHLKKSACTKIHWNILHLQRFGWIGIFLRFSFIHARTHSFLARLLFFFGCFAYFWLYSICMSLTLLECIIICNGFVFFHLNCCNTIAKSRSRPKPIQRHSFGFSMLFGVLFSFWYPYTYVCKIYVCTVLHFGNSER